MQIKTLTGEIDILKSEIDEPNLNMKRGDEDREKESKKFQFVVADQRAAQMLLTAALDILKGFYEKAAALVQEDQAPPPGFKEYKKNENDIGVMGVMQTIINDARTMEAEVIRTEENSQKAYEDFVKASNASD